MRNRSKPLLAGLCATLLLAAAVGTASANHLSVNEQGHRMTWRAFQFVFSAGSTVTCEVTLEGSFHSRTMQKVANALIGHINRASVGTCTGGSATVHRETLPWHEQYTSFTGSLPRITSVTYAFVGLRFRARNSVEECDFSTNQTEQGFGIIGLGAEGDATSIEASGTIRLSGSFICNFATGSLKGNGTVKTAAGGTLFVKLI